MIRIACSTPRASSHQRGKSTFPVKTITGVEPILSSSRGDWNLFITLDLMCNVWSPMISPRPPLSVLQPTSMPHWRCTCTLVNCSMFSSPCPTRNCIIFNCKCDDLCQSCPWSPTMHSFSFRSAFVTDEDANDRKSVNDTFIAFSIRLTKLLERKLQSMSSATRDRLPMSKNFSRPLLRLRNITHIIELYPFFHCLTRMHTYDHHHYQHSLPSHSTLSNKQMSMPKTKESSKKKNKSSAHHSSVSSTSSSSRKSESSTASSIQEETMSEIEASVLEDFVESWIWLSRCQSEIWMYADFILLTNKTICQNIYMSIYTYIFCCCSLLLLLPSLFFSFSFNQRTVC